MRDVARILEVPNHRIIYFCEEKVVEPLSDATGRGKVRRFSTRNLFEFSLVLKLMKGGINTECARQIISLLGEIEANPSKDKTDLRLPEGALETDAPDLRAIIGDGETLTFVITDEQGQETATPTFNLKQESGGGRRSGRRSPGNSEHLLGQPEGSAFIRTEVNVTGVAEDIMERLADER